MAEPHTIETYGPQPTNRNIWSSRLADSFVCPGSCSNTTTSFRCITLQDYSEYITVNYSSLVCVGFRLSHCFTCLVLSMDNSDYLVSSNCFSLVVCTCDYGFFCLL